MPSSSKLTKHLTYAVVGAGPAGLQMAYFLSRGGHDYAVFEAADRPGAFFETQPRHRKLLSLNKRFNGFPETEFNMRHDWNSLLAEGEGPIFGEYSEELYPDADDLCRYLADFAARHRLHIHYNRRILRISREADHAFLVEDEHSERWTCDRLIVGTGATAPYLPPDVEGIDTVASYEDHVLDPGHYANQTVLVIGRGNSAFEVANHLAGHAAIIHVAIGNRPIDLAWETHSVRNLRAINDTIVEMLHVKALHGAVGLNVRSIQPAPGGGFDVVADEEVPNWRKPGMLELRLHYDHVIRCTGFRYMAPELFDEAVRPEVCPKAKYPVLDSSWQSTTPDLYFIGTAMAARDKQAASSFIHGFRYNIRTLVHLLERRYHERPLPSRRHPVDSVAALGQLADLLLERLSTSAALYQQYGFLCDVLRFSDGTFTIHEELPKDYVLEDMELASGDVILMTFEYGFHRYPKGTNPLSFITQMDETTSRRCAAYLHPVFRHYRDGHLVSEDNLGESLTLRFGKYRALRPTPGPPPAEDVERQTLMNILNRVSQTTEEVFSERALLENHAFRPWPADRPLDADGLPRCSAEPDHGE